jgi:hypothetical protein
MLTIKKRITSTIKPTRFTPLQSSPLTIPCIQQWSIRLHCFPPQRNAVVWRAATCSAIVSYIDLSMLLLYRAWAAPATIPPLPPPAGDSPKRRPPRLPLLLSSPLPTPTTHGGLLGRVASSLHHSTSNGGYPNSGLSTAPPSCPPPLLPVDYKI